jgi:membrane protease YdiL (CAAX protease family)
VNERLYDILSDPSRFGGWAGLFFIVAISPAICEEALCRGFLFSGLRQRMAPWALVLTTALLFGIMHLNLYRMLGPTLLGLTMGLLVYKSGSILTSAIFHALNNGVAIVILMTVTDSSDYSYEMPVWLSGLCVGATTFGLVLIARERSPWVLSDKSTAQEE